LYLTAIATTTDPRNTAPGQQPDDTLQQGAGNRDVEPVFAAWPTTREKSRRASECGVDRSEQLFG